MAVQKVRRFRLAPLPPEANQLFLPRLPIPEKPLPALALLQILPLWRGLLAVPPPPWVALSANYGQLLVKLIQLCKEGTQLFRKFDTALPKLQCLHGDFMQQLPTAGFQIEHIQFLMGVAGQTGSRLTNALQPL